jgi:hypothetical protein
MGIGRNLLVGAFAFFALVGCGGKSVTGKWDVTEFQATTGFKSVVADLAPDGKMIMAFVFEQPAPGGVINIGVDIQGSYEHKDETFSMTANDMELKINNMPPALKSQEATIRKGFEGEPKKEMLDQINTLKNAKLTWVSDTSFQLNWERGTMTFTKA